MSGDFAPIETVARRLAGFPHPWFVSGGWALDLARDEVTRDHGDIEIGIFREDQGGLYRYLAGWRLHKAVEAQHGNEWVPWAEGEYLASPIFQVLVRPGDDQPPGTQEFEFFLNDQIAGQWHFRRDASIARPAASIVARSPRGVPILAPEIQLLYKARRNEPKDEHDFRGTLPLFTAAQRDWLRASLARVHPGHPWLATLGPPGATGSE